MRRATQALYAHHGHPSMDGCGPLSVQRCYVCGSTSDRGQRVADWMGDNFTGQHLVACPTSPLVCEACVWAMAGKPPDTLRMWCHLFDERGYVRVNKGAKPTIRDWLRGPKEGEWFAAIADSGKKHVVPFTPVNPAGSRVGRILFEEEPVSLPASDDGWAIVDDTTELLTLGATKAEIEPGEYAARAWGLCPDAIRDFEDRWGGMRHSAWFRLVVWLAQRDEERVAVRMEAEQARKGKKNEARQRDGGQAPHVDHGVYARRESDLPARVRADGGQETLGPPRDGAAHRHEDSGGAGGVGDHRDAPAAATKPHQLGLPGFA